MPISLTILAFGLMLLTFLVAYIWKNHPDIESSEDIIRKIPLDKLIFINQIGKSAVFFITSGLLLMLVR